MSDTAAAHTALRQDSFRIDNGEAQDLTIVLMPWGQELTIAPGMGVDVIFEGRQGLSGNMAMARHGRGLVITVRQEGVAYFRMSALSAEQEYRQAS